MVKKKKNKPHTLMFMPAKKFSCKFLGFDIDEKGIRPCKEKFKAMKEYPVPKNAKQVKRFLGMSSYYRKFIPNYSKITEPINRLLKKNCTFVWTELCETNFKF